MIEIIRAIFKLILFFIVTLLTVISVAVGNLVLGISNKKWSLAWKNKVIRGWARINSSILGLKIQTKGEPPQAPFFLVSNHLSYIDPLLFWYHLDATFVAKSEIKSWPFFGWGTRTLGVLFINRELRRDVRRMNKRISSSISEQQGVILFPEGTSTKGDQVKAFNAPLLKYPAETEMQVNYATIVYQAPEPWQAHLDVCWWGDMPFLSHFWKLLKMPGFTAKVIFGDETIIDDNRKGLAERLQKAVSQNFEPIVEKQTA